MASDILCLQETHLLSPVNIQLDEMTVTSSHGRHGIVVYTHNRVKILKSQIYVKIGIEIVHLTLIILNIFFEIFTVYKAPNIQVEYCFNFWVKQCQI